MPPYEASNKGLSVPIAVRSPIRDGNATLEPEGTLDCTNCIFEQPWWLEAVSPSSWGAATVEKGGRIVARLPYAIRTRFGLRLIGNPGFTPTLGPWLRLPEAKYATKLAEEEALLSDLIEKLPDCDLGLHTMVPEATNLLPFHWKGYQRAVSVTYRLEDLTDLDTVLANCDQTCRRKIRKAQRSVEIRSDLDVGTFCNTADKTFVRQGLKSPLDREVVDRIARTCRQRDAGRMFFAEDAQGRIHSVVFLVWDSRTAYYIMGGGDPELRASGAHSLLMWAAIQVASTVSRTFDFEGSSNKNIEQFFRSFGARQILVPRVYRMSRRMGALTGAKMILEALTGKKVKWFV